jgi:hypothetical protein
LLLPLCFSHRKHWRQQSWTLSVGAVGALLITLGAVLVVFGISLNEEGPGGMLVLAGLEPLWIGVLMLFGSLALYVVLTVRGIRIRRLSPSTVVLMHIALHFAEACRVHLGPKGGQRSHACNSRQSAEEEEGADPSLPFAK